MRLLGGGIRRHKVYGEWPGLEEGELNEKRELTITTDFREAIAPLIANHLQLGEGSLSRVFPGYQVMDKLEIV